MNRLYRSRSFETFKFVLCVSLALTLLGLLQLALHT